MRKGNKIITAICYIALAVVVVLGVMFLYRFTDGFNDDFKTFYLVHNGEDVMTAKTQATFSARSKERYDVKYTLKLGKEDTPKDYSVKIVPNTAVDFEYEIGNSYYRWSDFDDLSEAFRLKKESTYFTLTLPIFHTIEDMLAYLHPKALVTIHDELPKDSYFYTLVVSSYNKKSVYKIDFRLVAESEEEPNEEEPDDRTYSKISYEIVSSYNNTPLDVQNCPTQAVAGQPLAFMVIPEVIASGHTVWVDVYNADSGELIEYATSLAQGCFMFTVPYCDVLLKISYV